MKKIRNIIIVILIILLIIVCILIPLILNGNKETNDQNELNLQVLEDDEIIASMAEAAKDMEDYYNQNKHTIYEDLIRNCIRNFYNSRYVNGYRYRDENGNEVLPSNKEINENILQYLSKNYISTNNITSSNLNNYINLLNKVQNIVIVDIKFKNGKKSDTFAVHGIAVDSDYELTEEFYLYVYMDFTNETFAIEPINQYISDFSKFEVIAKDEEMPTSEATQFKYISVNTIDKMQGLLEKYKYLALAAPDIAYNYFDEEYRAARFGSLNNFKEFVEKNREDIRYLRIKAYLTEYNDGYNEYVVKDQYGNLYIFDEKNALDWTMKLDTYTIDSEKFTTEYAKATNKQKVQMNLDRFFQMINANDYRTAYSVLNPTFKNTYFPTEASFEQFMKQYTYTHANVKYSDFSDEISGVFTYNVELSNKQDETDDDINMNMVMQLQEGTNFTLSFQVIQ